MIALTIMIKIQKLQYSFVGVLICAAIGSGLELIPYAGHYIAVAFLYGSIAKVTGADMYPDAVFTVAVSYALMFCMNLFVIGMLIGNLGLARYEPMESDFADEDAEEEVVATNKTAVASSPAPAAREKTPAPAKATNVAKVTAPAKVQPKAAAEKTASAKTKERAERTAQDIAAKFSLKGISKSANQSIAMIHTGVKSYSILLGQTLTMRTATGDFAVTCDEMGNEAVILSIAGEQIELYLP
jgi:hypothetical protein